MKSGILIKRMLVFTGILLVMVLTAGCNKAMDKQKNHQTSMGEPGLTGKILMVGSTSMEKFANALAESFMDEYKGSTVTAEFVGSGAGIEAAIAGTAQIGNSSRALKDQEKSAGAVENIVALDGIAVIIDKNNSIDDLTIEQLREIYLGKVNNWKHLGGKNQPIVVIGREAASGTRTGFEELLEVQDECAYSNELDSTGAVVAKVATIPGAIGYVSLDVVNDTVKTAKIEGIAPTGETIKEGTYALRRPFIMATKGGISKQSQLVQTLFDYIHSDKGADLIRSVGLIPTD